MSEIHEKRFSEHWTDDPDLVEMYVLQRMTEEEKRKYEMHVNKCNRCRKIVEHEGELVRGIRLAGRRALRSRLQSNIDTIRPRTLYRYHYVSMAAAVVIIAVGLGIYRYWFGDMTSPKRFQQQEVIITAPDTSSASTEMADAFAERQRRAPRSGKGKSPEAIVEEDLGNTESASLSKLETSPGIWLIGTISFVQNTPSAVRGGKAEAEKSAAARPDPRMTKKGENISAGLPAHKGLLPIRLSLGSAAQLSDWGKNIQGKDSITAFVQQISDSLLITLYTEILTDADLNTASVTAADGEHLFIQFSKASMNIPIPQDVRSFFYHHTR